MPRVGDEIENPLTGERIAFLITASESNGELLELDDIWTRPGQRAAPHIHPHMQERWEVISGRAAFQIGEEFYETAPGDVVVADPGVPHLAWNSGKEPTHLRIQLRPALRWELFIERLFELSREAHSSGAPSPSAARLGVILREFREEIQLAQLPI